MVVNDRAAGMIISERLNRFRAYASQSGPEHRGYATFKLNYFVPVATRVVCSEDENVAEFRLGFATHQIGPPLKRFMKFLSSDAAKKALEPMFDVSVTVPRKKPIPREQGLRRGPRPAKLDEPILTY